MFKSQYSGGEAHQPTCLICEILPKRMLCEPHTLIEMIKITSYNKGYNIPNF